MNTETPVGPRLARREARRRQRRRLLSLLGGAMALVLVVMLSVTRLFGAVGGSNDDTGPDAAKGPQLEQQTMLLVRAPQESGAAKGVTLFAVGPERGRAVVLFLPVGTLMDIPGYGLDRLGSALQYGGGALVQATIENTLGLTVDAVATVSDAGMSALLGRIGSVEIDVPARLVSRTGGEPSLRFAAGMQHLDGPRLVEYLSFRERADDELSTFPRQEQVWQAAFSALTGAQGKERLDRLVGDGAPQLDTTVDAAWLRTLFVGLNEALQADSLQQRLLPVEPFGGAGPEGGATYRLHSADINALRAELFDASAPKAADGEGAVLRVEVLNGVGTPGVGQAVHRRLQGQGFRIVRTDNARNFDFAETQILVYDESRLPEARRLRSLLGVGTIAVSKRPQTVVDLTVVVGADFTSERR